MLFTSSDDVLIAATEASTQLLLQLIEGLVCNREFSKLIVVPLFSCAGEMQCHYLLLIGSDAVDCNPCVYFADEHFRIDGVVTRIFVHRDRQLSISRHDDKLRGVCVGKT